MTALAERSLATKSKYAPKRKVAPIARDVHPLIGQSVEIAETAGDTTLHALPTFVHCYGTVVEQGADPSLFLVRCADRGRHCSACVKRWLVRS